LHYVITFLCWAFAAACHAFNTLRPLFREPRQINASDGRLTEALGASAS